MLRLTLLSLLGFATACSSSTNAPPPGAVNDGGVLNDVGGGSDVGDSGSASAAIVASWVPPVAAGEAKTVALFKDVAFTKDGALLVVGSFQASTDLGKGAITAPDGEDDGFIAKFTYPALALQWVRNTNLAGADSWNSIAILPSGEAVVAGTVGPNGSTALRVARVSAANGDEVWSKTVTATGTSSFVGVTADSILATGSGVIVVSGTVEGTATLDAVTLKSTGYSDLYALALDESGTAKWGHVDGVSSADYRGYLALDSASGDLVLSGMQGSPERRLHVSRLNAADGTKRWSRTIGSPGQAEGNRAVSDGTSIYVTGDVKGTVQFDSDTETKTTGPLVAAFQGADGNTVPWAITRTADSSSAHKAFRDVALHNGKVVACGGIECVWLTPATGAITSTWSPGSGFAKDSSFGRVLVDGEGKLLLGGGGYGTITINGTKHEAATFAFRPFLLVLKP